MRRLGKFLALAAPERRSLVEAAVWLGVARLLLLLVPFRRLASYLDHHRGSAPEEAGDSPRLDAIAWAVATGSRHLPWKCTCLTQALAAKTMLQCRGIASTLYLGLARDGQAHLRAHAWLQVGARVLTGRREMAGFTPITSFPAQAAASPSGTGPGQFQASAR